MFDSESNDPSLRRKPGLSRAIAVAQDPKLNHADRDSASLIEVIFFRIVVLLRRLAVRSWHLVERTPPFLKVAFSREGLGCRDGWILLWGKFRRFNLNLFPPLVRYLQQHYKMEGGCTSCGASCKMFSQCVHWDEKTHLCKVYEDRPNICRTFPITPADIRDRNLANKNKPCGFTFKK